MCKKDFLLRKSSSDSSVELISRMMVLFNRKGHSVIILLKLRIWTGLIILSKNWIHHANLTQDRPQNSRRNFQDFLHPHCQASYRSSRGCCFSLPLSQGHWWGRGSSKNWQRYQGQNPQRYQLRNSKVQTLFHKCWPQVQLARSGDCPARGLFEIGLMDFLLSLNFQGQSCWFHWQYGWSNGFLGLKELESPGWVWPWRLYLCSCRCCWSDSLWNLGVVWRNENWPRFGHRLWKRSPKR